MQRNNVPLLTITALNLVSLDKPQLIDLLAHKTELLTTASLIKIVDGDYIESLRKEVVEIQGEIKNRTE